MRPEAAPRFGRVLPWLIAAACAGSVIGLRIPQMRRFTHGISMVHGPEAELPTAVLALVQLLVLFVGLTLPGILLAREGVRRWWWLPAAAFLFVPELHGHVEPRLLMGSEDVQWAGEWLVATVDLALLLLPGAVVAWRTPRRSSTLPWGTRMCALLVTAVGVALWGSNVSIGGSDPSDLGALIAIVSFAALWDIRSVGRAGVFIAVASTMTGTLPMLIAIFFDPFTAPSLRGFDTHLFERSLAVPALLALGIAPIARLLARLRDRHETQRGALPATTTA